MAKMNRKVSLGAKLTKRSDATLNKAGGIAFKPEAKTELFLRAASLLPGEDKYYASGNETLKELSEAVGSVMIEDPEFVLKLALFCREDMHLRHAPLHLITEYARYASLMRGSEYAKTIDGVRDPSRYVAATIQRADELAELLAVSFKTFGTHQTKAKHPVEKGNVPMLIKRGVALAFPKFDEYQFGKYGRTRNAEVSLKDALKITHPVPRDAEQGEVFKRIKKDMIPIPDTWEQYIMKHGSTAETWQEIIPKMGYMALLRNLRNFVEKGVSDDSIQYVIERLTNPDQVARSKQFPFRFYSASKVLEGIRTGDAFARNELIDAVKTALEISTCNVPNLPGRSVVFFDISGSMDANLSDKSMLTNRDVSALLGAIFNKITDNSVMGVFADGFEVIPRKTRDILATKKQVDDVGHRLGYSTNAYKAFRWLRKDKVKADRVFLLSDMQCWDSAPAALRRDGVGEGVAANFMKWQREVSPNAYLYSIDLAGYGTTQFPKDAKNVVTMAGWSEKLFQFASYYETDKRTMLAAIEAKSVAD